ncbi:helix-turn-helix domain-containing protein [Paenibacillus psychroresistens]|nr:helix-turn-helix domain-containing protein [Paenibacillus psychroresistens]
MSKQRFNLISLHEAIELLDVSRSTFDRWRKQRQLPFTKIGKEILVDKHELEQWVRHHSSDRQRPAIQYKTLSTSILEQPTTISVGYQSRSAQTWTSLIMKELGWFEEELSNMISDRSMLVRWIDAANGPELVQGLIGGHIQFASLGDYPIALSFSLSQVLPAFRPLLLAFDGKTAQGQGISLVVRNDLHIRHASELANRTISTVAQSSAGDRLSKLIHSLGIQDTRILHKEQDDSMESIIRRKIAGSVIGEPYISLIQHLDIGKVLFQEELGEDFLTGIVVEENWADNNHAITIAYLKAHLRVHELVRKDPNRVAGLISRIKDIPAEVAASVISKVRWDSALYTKDLKTLSLLNPDYSSSTGGHFVSDSGIKYSPQYLHQAIKALKLPILGDGLLQGDWDRDQIY